MRVNEFRPQKAYKNPITRHAETSMNARDETAEATLSHCPHEFNVCLVCGRNYAEHVCPLCRGCLPYLDDGWSCSRGAVQKDWRALHNLV